MTRAPTRQERLRRSVPAPDTVEGKLPSRPTKRAKPAARAAHPAIQEQSIMLSLQTVELKLLRISPLNVRKTNIDEDIAALAEDIAAHGLKQNLVVIPSGDGKFEVVAGGRRLQALHHLVDAGTLSLDEQIPVLVEDRSEGRETSLSENLHRIAMNPADEFTAFASIVQDHQAEPDPIQYCARRFGVSRGHVEQRLRLAALSPTILDALREGRIGVEAAKAYGSFGDHDLQLRVFQSEDKRTYGTKHDPRAIRDAMKSKTYPAGIAQAIYVGLDNYFDAGGRSETEFLLGQDDGERLIDPALLDKLAREKATVMLPDVVARDGFQSGMLTVGFSLYPSWPKAPDGFTQGYGHTLDKLTPEERAKQIGVYTLEQDGSGLKWIGVFRTSAPVSPASKSPVDWVAERAREYRRGKVQLRAALLTVPDLVGTPLEGRVKLPDLEDTYAVEEVDDDSGDVLVNIQIRVSAADLHEHEAEATQLVEADEAAEEEEKRLAAALATSDEAAAA